MSENLSVLSKAQRLHREAQRLDLGLADIREFERVQHRVDSLRKAVKELEALARTARFLWTRTGADIDLSKLTNGLAELTKSAAGNIPSNQAFTAAERRIGMTKEALAAEIQSYWNQWATGRRADLKTNRMAMLTSERQTVVSSRLRILKSLAERPATPGVGEITEFINTWELLSDELGQAADAPPALLDLMERLTRGAVMLAAVTDEEIALLRAHAMDQQFELRRKAL